MSLTIKPLSPKFGAEVSGVDLTKPLTQGEVGEIVEAMDQWGVCVYRDTGLTDESHIEFSRQLGPLFQVPNFSRNAAPAQANLPAGSIGTPQFRSRHKHLEIFDASNLDADGNIVANEMTMIHKRGDRQWHTDSSFSPEGRASYSLLLAYEVPPEGGPTHFSDVRSAYEDLPAATKERIENLVASHSVWYSRMTAGLPITEKDVFERPHAEHPLVQTHDGSGRKTLYIAAHASHIVDMPIHDGRKLLGELIAFATQPKYTIEVFYKPGDLVIWDNRCTMHRGGDYDDRKYRRDMRRTTVRDGAATGEGRMTV
jgi:alpha-ketoglutarate-dependent 2,4-dichlorophenoxyacetate dioxygenase